MMKPGDSVCQESSLVRSQVSLIPQTETSERISFSPSLLTPHLTKWLKYMKASKHSFQTDSKVQEQQSYVLMIYGTYGTWQST